MSACLRRLAILVLGCAGCASAGAPSGGAVTATGQPVDITGAELAVDVQQPPYKLTLPPALDKPGNIVWGRFRICADAAGQVTDVTVTESADPQVDASWVETMRTWRFKPHEQDGQAVAFCQNTRLEVKATGTP